MRGRAVLTARSTLQAQAQNTRHSAVVLMQLLPIFLVERERLREAKSAADTWPAGGTQLYPGARYQSKVEGSGRSMLAGEAGPFRV